MRRYKPIKYMDKKLWPPWYKTVIEYIHKNYNKRISLDEIAKISGYSKYHFCRIFKKLSENTVIDYVNAIRIEKAKQLLKNSTLTIMEISYEVGFSHISHFNRNFKRIVGVTPSAYCKNMDNQNIVKENSNIY
jgi:AraC-like DNA-binding protein